MNATLFQSALFPHALVLGVGVSVCAVDLLCCCFSLFPYLPIICFVCISFYFGKHPNTNFRHIVPHSRTQRGDQPEEDLFWA